MTNSPKVKIIYSDLSYKIIECAFEVHNQLGPGFNEDFYEQAMTIELADRGIQYTRQKPIKIAYKNHPLGVYRLDLIVEDKVVLELKATTSINDIHKQQLLSYVKASNYKLGILINFGSKKVESARIINS